MAQTKPSLRQFQCDTEDCPVKGNTWLKRDTECKCRECKKEATPIPAGEERGPLVFEFNCNCGEQYTVKCRREDTAKCYGCERRNSPIRFLGRHFIDKKTDREHGCSRCKDGQTKNCPNAQRHAART
jgi:hypothetical protein